MSRQAITQTEQKQTNDQENLESTKHVPTCLESRADWCRLDWWVQRTTHAACDVHTDAGSVARLGLVRTGKRERDLRLLPHYSRNRRGRETSRRDTPSTPTRQTTHTRTPTDLVPRHSKQGPRDVLKRRRHLHRGCLANKTQLPDNLADGTRQATPHNVVRLTPASQTHGRHHRRT